MKLKMKIKICIDIAMTLLLLFLMGYQFWGEILHEWAGIVIFLLFIAHHVLNINWHKSLFKGRYTAMRVFQLVVDFSVFVAMLTLMYSSIIMSRYVFSFLPIQGGMMWARRLHLLGSYWGFVLMSLHLGLHWNMMIGMAKKLCKKKTNMGTKTLCRVFSVAVAGYGLYVFIHRDLLTYMFLRNEFVFLDYDESKILFYVDYLAMMGLFVFLSHYFSKILRNPGRRRLEHFEN